MLRAIKQYFNEQLQPDADQSPSEHKLQIAAAALLFEVNRGENADADERDVIAGAVRHQFQLSDDETRELLELAAAESQDATSLHGFISLVNTHWSMEQRTELVEFMWRVAYADNRLDDHEVHLMRKIARLLYIPHKKFIGAKLRARDNE